VGVDDNLSPACVKLLKADDQVEYMQVRTTNELGICDVAFSPDGHLFAVVSAMQRNVNKSTPSEIKVYNLATKEVVFSQTDSCSLIRVLFAPTGRTLVAAGQRDFLTGIVKVWDLDALLPGNLGK
jgi:WD40 repeat protein